jgi:peptidoglycan/LPS O-acetylase OafA/YrhL
LKPAVTGGFVFQKTFNCLNLHHLKTDQLTFTRFIAAIIIVFFHFGVDTPPFNNHFFRPLIVNSGLAVSYFFVLSGFVMMIAYGKKNDHVNTRDYLINRAARILPVYYAALILMLVYYFLRIYVLKTPSTYYPNFIDTFLNATLTQSWIPEKAGALNPPAWSLSVEAFFYLSFPFIFNRIYKKLSLRSYIINVVIFFIASQLIFHFLIYTWPSLKYYFYFQPLLRLNEFLVGTAVGAIFLTKSKPFKHSALILFLLLIVAVFILRTDFFPIDFHNGLFALLFAPMLYVLARNQGKLNRLFSRKSLIFLGEISYGVYIFQQPVYFLFTGSLTFCGFKMIPELFYLYLLILIGVSTLCQLYVEIPLRKNIRKLKKAPATA